MSKRQKIIVSITGIFLVLLILVGLTYAYFLTRIQGNTNTKSISLSTANLAIVYGDGNQNIITKEKIQPGEIIGEKDFTVTNEGNSAADYMVVIDNVSIKIAGTNTNTTFVSNDFTYTLTCVQKNKNTNEVSGTCESVTETSLPLNNNGLLVANNIPENMRHEYTLTVTYKETNIDQSADMNKSLEAKLDIKDIKDNPFKSNTNYLSYNLLNNAMLKKNGTDLMMFPYTAPAEFPSTYIGELIDAKLSDIFTTYYPNNIQIIDTLEDYQDYNKWNTTTINGCTNADIGKYVFPLDHTDPSQIISCSVDGEYIINHEKPEASISVTADDYGTSYYFRGRPLDNYVNFAGICWRVVRIDGKGNIKIVLEDQDNTCQTSNGNWDIPTTTGGSTKSGYYGYTEYSTGTISASDGTTNSSNVYIMDYLNGQTHSDSSLSTAFYNFQTGTISSYLNKLEVGDWCLNDVGYSRSGSYGSYTYTRLTNSETIDRIVKGQDVFYDSYVRLSGNKGIYSPTLKCNGTVMNKFSNDTDMYVGTLTADEIAYAGGKNGQNTDNTTYYLANNYQVANIPYTLTLSPSWGGNILGLSAYESDGALFDLPIIANLAMRPAVLLKSGTTIQSGGDGTKTNPYVIN